MFRYQLKSFGGSFGGEFMGGGRKPLAARWKFPHNPRRRGIDSIKLEEKKNIV